MHSQANRHDIVGSPPDDHLKLNAQIISWLTSGPGKVKLATMHQEWLSLRVRQPGKVTPRCQSTVVEMWSQILGQQNDDGKSNARLVDANGAFFIRGAGRGSP